MGQRLSAADMAQQAKERPRSELGKALIHLRGGSGPLTVRSALVGNVFNDNVTRSADYQRRHLQVEQRRVLGSGAAMLQARVVGTGLVVAASVRTSSEGTAASSARLAAALNDARSI